MLPWPTCWVEVGMPVGWAKNWAGARGCCSSCTFGMGEERLEPLTKALLVKGRCRCCVGFSSSKAGLLAIWGEFRRTEGGWGQSCFLFILFFPSLQALVALRCCLFLSLSIPLVSNPKTSWGATQLLLFSSFAYKSPFLPSGKPCAIIPVLSSMCTHTNLWSYRDKCCIKITHGTSKLWFKQGRWKMPCWPNAH